MAEQKEAKIHKRIWQSILNNSVGDRAKRNRKTAVFRNLILHLHPPTIHENAIRFNLTFGLGGMAALLFVLQILTGILLRFVYEPFPGLAYDSILYLQSEVVFGQLIRNIHHWSGIFLILIVFLHLLRVYFTGAFFVPRQFNWILGLFLLVFTVLSNFTGYLLPWDQLAYWAITVSTGMLEYIPVIGNTLREMTLGGEEVGAATLLIFYNLHTSILPIVLIVFMSYHFWRVRKAGGVVIQDSAEKSTNNYVATVPHLVARELVVALVLIALIMVLSAFFNAPLQAKANPDFSPNPAKAPWYFQGFQELLLHFQPVFAVLIIPALAGLALIAIPYIKYDHTKSGEWFISEKGRQTGIISAILTAIIVPVAVLIDKYWLSTPMVTELLPDYLSKGIIPLVLVLLFLFAYERFLKKKYNLSSNESRQAIFIVLLIGFIILTITSIAFRGKGMELTWPWLI